jgi:hypothetical protein
VVAVDRRQGGEAVKRFVLLVAALVALGSQPAAAHRVWLPSERLAPDGGQSGDVEVTSLGEAVVSWIQYSGPGAFPMSARVAVKEPGAPLGPPKVLDTEASGGPITLATDGAGNTLAAWSEADSDAMVARRTAGGEFSDPVALGVKADFAGAYMNPRGEAVVLLWEDGAVSAMFGSATGGFSAPVPVDSASNGDIAGLAVALTDGGELIVATTYPPDGLEPGRVRVSSVRADGTGAAPRTLYEGGWVGGLAIGADATGAAALTWSEGDQPYAIDRSLIAERPAGGDFGEPRSLEPEVPPGQFAMVVAPDGTMTIAGQNHIWTARIGERPRMSAQGLGGYSGPPVLAASRSSETLIAFTPDGWDAHLVSTTRSGAGDFEPVEDVRPGCDHVEYFQVAVGEGGTAAAFMTRRDELALAVDAPSPIPGSQECVDDPALYGKEPRETPATVYPTRDWELPPVAPVEAPGLVLRRIRITGEGARRTAVVDVDCGGPCRLSADAALRFRGGGTLGRARTAGRAKTKGRARLKLRLRASRRMARRFARHPRRQLQIRLRVVAVDPGGVRHVKVATRSAR